jgi:DSF synthase
MRTQHDAENNIYWAFMHTIDQSRPCCSWPLVEDAIALQRLVRTQTLAQRENGVMPFTHLVIASDAPVFNLGGDLELFARCIRRGDRETLLRYALLCVEGVAGLQDIAAGSVHSIAVVQGDALGGGLELALACNTFIAEEGVQMGFPEVLFGLFPGMGAFSFLRRRTSAMRAQRMVLNGQRYKAEELYELGIVDVLVPRGEGLAAARRLVQNHRRAPLAHQAVNRVYQRYESVPIKELQDITTEWVDSAMALGERGVRTIERVVQAQSRRFRGTASATTVVPEPPERYPMVEWASWILSPTSSGCQFPNYKRGRIPDAH